MFLAILAAVTLAPGLATAWSLRHRGWPIAVLAGVGVTAALPFLLIVGILAFPPLGVVVAVGSAIAALQSYDRGSIVAGASWAAVAVLATVGVGWHL
ncbi:hypothetical protein [Streptomyces naphthomycinicus]|uniref:hypothetical protein n=1 Tax=Streptomyces naphthomycinicus TaxID=2872625 RepID=UPI001CED8F74|nr:hypothetical protein [Streptomyces sp. TML10]